MGGKDFVFFGLVLAVSTYAQTGSVSSSPAPRPPSTASPQQDSKPCSPLPDEGPWAAANEIFRLQTAPSQEHAACEYKQGQSLWSCIPKTTKLQFLIAAIADPSQTHLSLDTDRGLESLMWAIGDSGYSFERYWLPWSIAKEDGASGADQCRTILKRAREAEPGLLIFRRNRPPDVEQAANSDEFLFVFVAGETPTSGLRRSALSKAIGYIQTLDAATDTIRILGPNFSGSLQPLISDLAATYRDRPALKVHLVSGTISNVDAIQNFRAALPGGSQYESTVENDVRATRLFFNYVDVQGRPSWMPSPSEEVAILSEDETAYGGGDVRHSLKNYLPFKEKSHDWLMLRYPREIARLRNAYSNESVPSSQSKQGPAVPSDVPLTLRDSQSANGVNPHTDSLATYSELQSPASQQAVLLVIASTLRRERAAYAGIVATDVLDSLFLARFLRLSDPDLRIFTLDADLLFLRESEDTPMTGMLAVTNYPLFSRNQHWTKLEVKGSMPRRIQFSSRFAEGIYNACRRLIPPVNLQANGEPVERYLEYERPFDERREGPPLWLTILGRDGYWPVALLDETKPADDEPSTISLFAKSDREEQRKMAHQGTPAQAPPLPPQIHESLRPETPSKGWSLFFSLALLFCYLHVIYVSYLLCQPKQVAPDRRPSLVTKALGRLFAAYPDSRPNEFERPFLLSATVSLFSSMIIVSLPLCRFLGLLWAQWYFGLALACLVALLTLAVILTFRNNQYWRVVGITWILAVLFPSIWLYLILRGDFHAGIFLAYRSLYLGNGVSPGIPIALLAAVFYAWAWVHLKQESNSGQRKSARQSDELHYLPEFQSLMWSTDNSIEDIRSAGISGPASALLLLWFLILWPLSSVRTIESVWYDLLYVFVLTVLYWSIALVWVQAIRCWRRFRALLQALERHPIRNAFSRLPKEISWIPLVSVSRPRNLFVSSRSYECLRAIVTNLEGAAIPSALYSRLLPLRNQAQDAIVNLEGNVDKAQDPDLEVYANLQVILETAASHIVKDLQAGRWSEGESNSLNEMETNSARAALTVREKLIILEEEFVALRFLLFMRYVIRQLRDWITFIAAGFIVSIISLNAYPFQARRWIGLASVILLVGIGSGIAFMFAEMDKDAVLSRITDTKKNEVGKTFFFRLAQYGTLPVFTVVAAQFPSIGRYLFSWLQPALEALK